AAAEALKANKGYRAVSVVPALKEGHPVAEVTLVKGAEWKTESETLDRGGRDAERDDVTTTHRSSGDGAARRGRRDAAGARRSRATGDQATGGRSRGARRLRDERDRGLDPGGRPVGGRRHGGSGERHARAGPAGHREHVQCDRGAVRPVLRRGRVDALQADLGPRGCLGRPRVPL